MRKASWRRKAWKWTLKVESDLEKRMKRVRKERDRRSVRPETDLSKALEVGFSQEGDGSH